MPKMKLLIITQYPKLSGVDYHRLFLPHGNISKRHPEIEVDNINEIDSATVEFLKQYDYVVANRFISKTGNQAAVIQKLKQAGVRYILDLDDDYRIPQWHVLYEASRIKKHSEQISYGAKYAHAVTCTQPLLADVIRKETGQQNVYVVPNGIEPAGQFEVRPCQFKDKVNFGWSGSVTHFDDVLLMFDGLLSLYKNKDFENKFRVVYGGYEPTDDISKAIAGVLSAKGVASKNAFHIYNATDVFKYAEFYDLINVALIPLRDNRFNNLKSNLKLLESGFKKKAVIVSGVEPYLPLLKHGKNCLVVKHKNDWYKHMTKLINNPAMIEDLSAQLYEDVQPFHIDKVSEIRKQIL